MRPLERRAEPQRARRNERSAVLDALQRADRRADRRRVERSIEYRDGRRNYYWRNDRSAVLDALRRADRRDRYADYIYRDRDRDRYIYVDDRDRYYIDYGRDRYWDRYYVDYDRYRGNRGPAFCRSGAGHPVFGHRWCIERGYYGPRRDVRYVYVDDRDRYYIDYDRDHYRRPRHKRPRTVVHYVIVNDRDRYYDPYYGDPYGYDPYHNAGYYDPYYGDPYGYDPYYGDPYGYDPYYRRDNDSLLENILEAIFFPQTYYMEEPAYYVMRPRYYVAPPAAVAFAPSNDLTVTAFAGSPAPLSAYPSSYYPPTTYSLVSLNLTI